MFTSNDNTMKTRFPTHRRGFTLIELLVVITIIAILAGLSMGGYGYITRKQADSQANVQISLLSKALEEYKLENGTYPPTGSTNSLYTLLYWNGANATPPGKIYLADLDPNSKKHGWIDGTGAAARIIDPWGNEYIYRRGDNSSAKNPDFDLASRGKDGTLGNADDIDNY
jgi:general secretion pathway protein G